MGWGREALHLILKIQFPKPPTGGQLAYDGTQCWPRRCTCNIPGGMAVLSPFSAGLQTQHWDAMASARTVQSL